MKRSSEKLPTKVMKVADHLVSGQCLLVVLHDIPKRDGRNKIRIDQTSWICDFSNNGFIDYFQYFGTSLIYLGNNVVVNLLFFTWYCLHSHQLISSKWNRNVDLHEETLTLPMEFSCLLFCNHYGNIRMCCSKTWYQIMTNRTMFTPLILTIKELKSNFWVLNDWVLSHTDNNSVFGNSQPN